MGSGEMTQQFREHLGFLQTPGVLFPALTLGSSQTLVISWDLTPSSGLHGYLQTGGALTYTQAYIYILIKQIIKS